MAEPTTLINAFLDAEFVAARAAWTERDDDRFEELLSHVSRHVAKSAWLLFEPGGRDMAELDDFEGDDVDEGLAEVRRRTLYATASWHHPKEGLVVTAYVDRPSQQSHRGPTLRLHLLMDRTPPQFVAREAQCTTCRTSGKRGEARCEDCNGVGWTGYRGNLDLGPIVHLGEARLHVPRSQVLPGDLGVLQGLGL